MHYTIREYNDYDAQQILPLYASVGWVNYTNHPQMLQEAFRHSLRIYAAYADERLIGVIRVVGDGCSVIFVQDLLVHPDYQRQGVGTALLQQILQTYSHVYQLHLIADRTDQTIQFYKSLGFAADADIGCLAFSRYHIG